MKATFITTMNHNVGDDFVREGILYLFRKALVEHGHLGGFWCEPINKHNPIMIRRILKNVNTQSRFNRALLQTVSPLIDMKKIDRMNDAMFHKDFIVQCGTPFYWANGRHHCHDNEWYKMLIKKRWYRSLTPFYNIGIGTCQPYHSDGSEILNCRKCRNYIRETYAISELTTVRDKLSYDILEALDIEPIEPLPCPSLFSSNNLDQEKRNEKFLIINYMRKAGHYKFTSDRYSYWEGVMREFYNSVKKNFMVLFVCHDQQEIKDAKRIDPEANIFYSDNYMDYVKVYASAICGVVNRVHGAFAMASYGIPSVVVGSDSRARSVEEIGITPRYVSSVTPESLKTDFEYAMCSKKKFKKNIDLIKEKSFEKYKELLCKTFSSLNFGE